MSAETMRLHLRRVDFPAVTTFVAYQGWYVLVIPAGFLCLGVLAIHVWKSKTAFGWQPGVCGCLRCYG